MKLSIISFGQIAAITGNNFVLEETIENTDTLKHILHAHFPQLAQMKYALAVNKKMINENTLLTENASIALLPPFSGG